MKKLTLSLLFVFVLFVNVQNALAYHIENESVNGHIVSHKTVNGQKVNSHIMPVKEVKHSSCKNNESMPVLDSYIGAWQNDGTPLATAYNDYLSDLAWYASENPNNCKITPEVLP